MSNKEVRLKIENGTKVYKQNVVFSNINLEFEEGKITAILGENGSGKTVLLKALAGFVTLTEGVVLQGSNEIGKKGIYIQNAGIVIEHPDFMHGYTLRENLNFISKFCKEPVDLDFWIDFYDLREHENKKYKHLSLGTKQKMLLIQAFMGNPYILLLDEPFNGLDRESVEKTKELLEKYRDEGKTIVLASHIHNKDKEFFDRKLLIENGAIYNI